MLLPATTTKPGEPYDDLDEVYGRLLGQWALEMNHVAAIVGGFNSQQKHVGQDGVRFTPIRARRQARAVQFLNANAFKTPACRSIRTSCAASSRSACSIGSKRASARVLNSLLSTARVNRLVEQEAIDGAAAYQPRISWPTCARGSGARCTATAPVAVDAYRRNLQRAYIETLADRVNGRTAAADDARAFFRGELKTLDGDLKAAAAKANDRETKLHLDDIQTQIARALDPSVQAPAAAAGTARPGTALDDTFDLTIAPDACWPDYAIRRPGGGIQ